MKKILKDIVNKKKKNQNSNPQKFKNLMIYIFLYKEENIFKITIFFFNYIIQNIQENSGDTRREMLGILYIKKKNMRYKYVILPPLNDII